MVPSCPGVFVPGTSLNVVHSSYVSPPRIASERFVVDAATAASIQNGTDDPSKRGDQSGSGPDRQSIAKQQDVTVSVAREGVSSSPSTCVDRYHHQQQPHFRTIQATMQPYYLQGSPAGTFLYMQPAVFSPPPQVFDPYGRPTSAPASVLQQQTDVLSSNIHELAICNNEYNCGSTELITTHANNIEEKHVEQPPENIDEAAACRQAHEHLCYHTEVVVKLPPKKKHSANVVVAANMTTSVQQDPASQTSCSNGGEKMSTEMNASDKQAASSLQQIEHVTNEPASSGYSVVVQEEEEDKDKEESKPQPPAPSNQAPNKSWASLFDSSSCTDKVRPMARVSPRIKTNPQLDDVNYKMPPVVTNRSVLSSSVAVDLHTSNLYLKRLGEFLSSYEPDHKIVSLQPRGLTNRNNWCYVNAILQSLIACPPFYNFMKAAPIEPRKRYPETLIMEKLYDFVREFVPANARIGKREKCARNRDGEMAEIFTGAPLEPSGIYNILDKLGGQDCFEIQGRQEDAEEFLSCLLNGLNDEMYELIKATKNPMSDNLSSSASAQAVGSISDTDTDADAAAAWTVMGPKNKSSVTRRAVCGKTPISDIFRGQLRSRVLKAGDQPPTDNVVPFFTLQLDIEKSASVKEALELLVGKDVLEGVTCSKTHRQVEAWTQTTLEDLPVVLILHLKCFLYKPDGCSKIVKCVDFPVDLKIDGKCISANRKNKYTLKQRSYKLIAVVHHDGKEATRGHYVTDAYHVGYGCWIRYDDGAVRSVPESSVLKPRAPRVPYLLYYRRGDTIGGCGTTK